MGLESVSLAPTRFLRILRVRIANSGPIHGIEDRIPAALDIGTHLKTVYGTPLPAFACPFAVQAPKVFGTPRIREDSVTV
jgi:hypothetical protein